MAELVAKKAGLAAQAQEERAGEDACATGKQEPKREKVIYLSNARARVTVVPAPILTKGLDGHDRRATGIPSVVLEFKDYAPLMSREMLKPFAMVTRFRYDLEPGNPNYQAIRDAIEGSVERGMAPDPCWQEAKGIWTMAQARQMAYDKERADLPVDRAALVRELAAVCNEKLEDMRRRVDGEQMLVCELRQMITDAESKAKG